MEQTRRQFLKATLSGAAVLAAGTGMAQAGTLAAGKEYAGLMSGPVKGGRNTKWKSVKVSDGTEMRVFFAYPDNAKKDVPAVIVLQEVFGLTDHIRDVTQRIAKLGYVAAAPELYHRTAPNYEGSYDNPEASMPQMHAMTDAGIEEDLKATYALLREEEQVDPERIASVGYCMGGRVSYMANAVLPLAAAVSYYGGGIAPKLLPRAKEQHGPLLLFWGGKDKHIGHEQQYAVAAALRQAEKSFVNVEFSDADHGFFCNVRKSYHPVAARESWALFSSFLRDHLQAPA